MLKPSTQALGTLLLSVLWVASHSQAQTSTTPENAKAAAADLPASSPASATGNPAVAAEVRLVVDATARTAPPHGPLNLFVGDKVFNFKKGSVVEVVGRKTYGGFSGAEVWLEVLPATEAAALPRKTVWVHGGSLTKETVLPDGVTSVNIAPRKSEK